jgi:signal transduction histidine kinase
MARLLAPRAAHLLRRFNHILIRRGYDAPRRKALLAVTPAAASLLLAQRRPSSRFIEQVEYASRRLAKLNVPPSEVVATLRWFDRLLDAEPAGRLQSAREQLHLATLLALNNAFYEVRESETQAFFGLAQAESKAGDLQDLLRRFVRVLARAFGACGGAIVLVPAGVPARLRKPRYIEGIGSARRMVLEPGIRKRALSWWSIPVDSGGKASAVIQLGFATRYPWLPRELELACAAARRCGQAIERARLLQQLAERERVVLRLAAEARRAEEAERRRLGRELHDETGQGLLVLRLQLEMLEREMPDNQRGRVAEARSNVERCIEELRRMIAALSPAIVERLGLPAALRHLAGRLKKVHPACVLVRIPPELSPLPAAAAEVIYRVAQECLQNVARHSQASHVNLSLRVVDKSIRLTVSDNGIGFDAEATFGKPWSYGMAGMRERAALMGGKLKIRSAPGQGASVTLELPRGSARTARNVKNSPSSHR